ncbi:MAG: DUF192 domain-containing protein [Candidatus Omnitrophota bacterium]
MKIINLTKNTLLADTAALASTPLKRFIGLLGRRAFLPGEALVLKPCNSIHTFFMRFPIDVLFLDKNGFVLKGIANLKPFRLTAIYFGAKLAIELPSGTIQESLTQPKDKLVIE